MVDFRKRVAEGAAEILLPGEQVIAGVSVTESPFRVGGAGFTSGMIAGGVLGAAVGTAVDKHRDRRESERESVRAQPDVALRSELEPAVPRAGGLLGITTERVLVWSVSGMGKPKDLLHAIELHDVDTMVWQRLEAARLAGLPASIVMWIGLGQQVLPCAAIDMGPSAKHARGVIEALAARRPGRVVEFTAG